MFTGTHDHTLHLLIIIIRTFMPIRYRMNTEWFTLQVAKFYIRAALTNRKKVNQWLSLFMLPSSMVRIIFRPISLNFFSISLFPLILQLGSGLHLPIESLLWHLGQLPSGRLSKIVDSEATTKAATIMISRSADFISSKKEI